MQLKNIMLGLRDQMPIKRFLKNICKGGFGCFWHPRTHLRGDGLPKIMYNTRVSAKKAALAMEAKTQKSFSCWKCWRCDGYHIGKNNVNTNE